MNNLILFLQKTLGQKIIIGLTGLGLCLFIFVHMLGNLLILAGPKEYNLYAHGLHEMLILEILEIGIFGLFIGHIVTSMLVNIKNKIAKGEPYKIKASGQKKTFIADQLLVFQGVVILVFLALHLLTFKFGTYYETTIDGKTVRDIYRLVQEFFQNHLFVLGYTFSLIILTIHVIHGLPASLKTLGFYHPRYSPWVEKISWVFGLGVMIGFLTPMLYLHLVL